MSKRVLLGVVVASMVIVFGSVRRSSSTIGYKSGLLSFLLSNRILGPHSSGRQSIQELEEKFESVTASYIQIILNHAIIREPLSKEMEFEAAIEENSKLGDDMLGDNNEPMDNDKHLRGN